ncbi:hypothetical protein KKC1_17140, partial [Calderihabitans maritimus]
AGHFEAQAGDALNFLRRINQGVDGHFSGGRFFPFLFAKINSAG